MLKWVLGVGLLILYATGSCETDGQRLWAQRLESAVSRAWMRPPNVTGNPWTVIKVKLADNGSVSSASIKRPSGNNQFDQSVLAAVYKASPLPLPAMQSDVDDDISITFCPYPFPNGSCTPPDLTSAPNTSAEPTMGKGMSDQDRKSRMNRALMEAMTGSSLATACNKFFSVGELDVQFEQIKQCESDIVSPYRGAITAAGFTPVSCDQVAIRAGASDGSGRPPSGMAYNPIEPVKGPISFYGEIRDGEEGTVSIQSGADNAIVETADAIIFQGDDMTVGRTIQGFGHQTGSQKVQLTSGEQTTIPVITATCIEVAWLR